MNDGVLRLGIAAINSGPYADPALMAEVSRRAEDAGFDSLWVVEHVVLPHPRRSPGALRPEHALLDPLLSLTFAAAHTTHVKLGTGVLVVPYRRPAVMAKELATLDALSGGRLILGIGVGNEGPELDAVGIPVRKRGPLTDEYLDAMKTLWREEPAPFEGRTVAFSGVMARPLPRQRPHPPIVVGARTPAAYPRAVRVGNGWYGYGFDPDQTREAVVGLREAAQRLGRPAELGPLEITVCMYGELDLAIARRFAEAGAHRLNVILPRGPNAEVLDAFFAIARTVIGQVDLPAIPPIV